MRSAHSRSPRKPEPGARGSQANAAGTSMSERGCKTHAQINASGQTRPAAMQIESRSFVRLLVRSTRGVHSYSTHYTAHRSMTDRLGNVSNKQPDGTARLSVIGRWLRGWLQASKQPVKAGRLSVGRSRFFSRNIRGLRRRRADQAAPDGRTDAMRRQTRGGFILAGGERRDRATVRVGEAIHHSVSGCAAVCRR